MSASTFATIAINHLLLYTSHSQGQARSSYAWQLTIDDLQNYCLGACNGANRRCQVRCQAGRAHAKTGRGDSVHTNFDRRKLMTLNNRRSVVVLPIFTPNTLLERACFELNENVWVLKMKQGTVKWQGVQSWPKCWLSGSCRRAQCQRWWTMNICHSVVSMSDIQN